MAYIYSDTSMHRIDVETKEIDDPGHQPLIVGEALSHYIPFEISSYKIDGVDVTGMTISVVWWHDGTKEKKEDRAINVQHVNEDEFFTFGWVLDENTALKPGTLYFYVRISDGNGYVWRTLDAKKKVVTSKIWEASEDGDIVPDKQDTVSKKFEQTEKTLVELRLTDHIQYRDVKVDEYVNASVLVDGATTYKWQYSDDLIHWYDSTSSGANTDTVSVKGKMQYSGRYYRCIVGTVDGNVVTGLAKINVIEKEDLQDGSSGLSSKEKSTLVNLLEAVLFTDENISEKWTAFKKTWTDSSDTEDPDSEGPGGDDNPPGGTDTPNPPSQEDFTDKPDVYLSDDGEYMYINPDTDRVSSILSPTYSTSASYNNGTYAYITWSVLDSTYGVIFADQDVNVLRYPNVPIANAEPQSNKVGLSVESDKAISQVFVNASGWKMRAKLADIPSDYDGGYNLGKWMATIYPRFKVKTKKENISTFVIDDEILATFSGNPSATANEYGNYTGFISTSLGANFGGRITNVNQFWSSGGVSNNNDSLNSKINGGLWMHGSLGRFYYSIPASKVDGTLTLDKLKAWMSGAVCYTYTA